MNEPKPIHRLNVMECNGVQSVQAVVESQDCGLIVGGGTCPQPLRIELSPAYAYAPEMLAALKAIRDARDHLAENGSYPDGTVTGDQEFDDWAADLADSVISQAESKMA